MGGEFDDWRPGVHTLERRKDGKRAVTVELPADSTHSVRYLMAVDYRLNDESAGDRGGVNIRLQPSFRAGGEDVKRCV
ncbi:hypothetical protein ACU4GG_01040 [Streptomyces nojiriensis]